MSLRRRPEETRAFNVAALASAFEATKARPCLRLVRSHPAEILTSAGQPVSDRLKEHVASNHEMTRPCLISNADFRTRSAAVGIGDIHD